MTVAELPDRRADHAARPAHDRTPPQDIAAEQSVLGGMLLSKDAIADVVEVLRGHDFYRPAHETIYDATLDLYGRGEPADPVTVAAELQKRGELGRVGGAPYLHTLVSSVPTAANAGYYAAIVRERAVLRRLVEAGTRIVQMGYGGDADADEIVDRAQAEVYSVTDRRLSDDYRALGDVMEGTLDEIEAIGSRGGQLVGVPTGFADLDALTNGLHPGQLVMVAARPAIGKALALDTPLPTPAGWTTMGEVRTGDQLFAADGRPTRVIATSEIMDDRPCYQVEFSDGSVIVADAEHLWTTTTRASRRQHVERKATYQWPVGARAAVKLAYRAAMEPPAELVTIAEVGHPDPGTHTTAEIAATLRHPADGHLNHSVQNLQPLCLPENHALPVPPYTLGAWLGDGHSQAAGLTTIDSEVLGYVEADGFVLAPGGRSLSDTIKVPELPPIAERECVVCGTRFTPRGPNVYACGGVCGEKSKNLVPSRAGCASCGRVTAGTGATSRRCARCHQRYGSFVGYLPAAGVLGDKHIPTDYLRTSQTQRRALLAGLLDTDGTVTSTGAVQFTTTSRRLAEGVQELIVSLGYRCSMTTRAVKGRTAQSSVAYTINFSTADDVFRLERKKIAHKERCVTNARVSSRFITAVKPIPSVPVRCVMVDNADGLFLAGRSMIPTHNSTLGLDVARAAAIRHQLASVIFSLEMSRNEITMRLLSAEARVPLHHMRSGQMSDDDWNRIARRTGEISSAPLYIDDSPNLTMMEIRAKCRRLKQRHDLRLVIVDYLQLMTSGKRVENRQQEVAEFSRAMKLLAKELDVPVVAISQLNRSPEQRSDKRPLLSDLRESGSLEQDSDVVILLHREDAYEKESPRAGEADFIVAKHRNGPTATITVAFQGHYSRFVDMAR
ncbi:MAG: replicative DNA helicase [Jiangellaceae bacterium]|nr:replicative DNA helicase [Jiangellaceae bacterium]